MNPWSEAADAADSILEGFYDVTKTLDPLHPRDFERIVLRMTRALKTASKGQEAGALRAAMGRLDVDWPNLTPAAQDRVIEAARKAMGPYHQRVMPAIKGTLRTEAVGQVKGSRSATRREYGLKIKASLSTQDERTVKFITESPINFIRDEMGRRSLQFSKVARQVVSRGVRDGLGRTDIAENLQRVVPASYLTRSSSYWSTVASAFTAQARTYTTIGAFHEAAITEYEFLSVMDEVTTQICRMLHGRVWTVSSAIDHLNHVQDLTDPEAITNVAPWVNTGKNANGQAELYVNRDGRRHVLGRIAESGYGRADAPGRFVGAASNDQLSALGVQLPPLHGHCRSQIVPR